MLQGSQGPAPRDSPVRSHPWEELATGQEFVGVLAIVQLTGGREERHEPGYRMLRLA